MKRNPFGIETKPAAAAGIGGLVTFVLLLNTWQHWFTPPPPDVTAAIEAFAVGVAGYFAKHTPRPVQPAVISIEGDPSKQPAIIKVAGTVAEAHIAQLKFRLQG